MASPASLIPELEEVVQHGTGERRVLALQRITALFLDGANRFTEQHIRVFEDVFLRLIDQIAAEARAEFSERLAPVSNAPAAVVHKLATDDDIAVAGPVLRCSPRLDEAELVDIATTKSQAHLLAISVRQGITEPVTDVLVQRGDRDVARTVAQNCSARLSQGSFSALVKEAETDIVLAESVGLRPDILPRQGEARSRPRDYAAARSTAAALQQEGALNEVRLVEFAEARRYEETVASLALLCGVPIDVVDRLMGGGRPDPILILCKAAGWGWLTARALILSRAPPRPSSRDLDTAFSNFERLSRATAQRVLRFWQARRQGPTTGGG